MRATREVRSQALSVRVPDNTAPRAPSARPARAWCSASGPRCSRCASSPRSRRPSDRSCARRTGIGAGRGPARRCRARTPASRPAGSIAAGPSARAEAVRRVASMHPGEPRALGDPQRDLVGRVGDLDEDVGLGAVGQLLQRRGDGRQRGLVAGQQVAASRVGSVRTAGSVEADQVAGLRRSPPTGPASPESPCTTKSIASSPVSRSNHRMVYVRVTGHCSAGPARPDLVRIERPGVVGTDRWEEQLHVVVGERQLRQRGEFRPAEHDPDQRGTQHLGAQDGGGSGDALGAGSFTHGSKASLSSCARTVRLVRTRSEPASVCQHGRVGGVRLISDDEYVVVRTRTHAKALILPSIGLILLGGIGRAPAPPWCPRTSARSVRSWSRRSASRWSSG